MRTVSGFRKLLKPRKTYSNSLRLVVVVDQLDDQAVVGADRRSGERFMSLRTARCSSRAQLRGAAGQCNPDSQGMPSALVPCIRFDAQIAVSRCRKAERPFGTLRLLPSESDPFRGRSEEGAYSCGGTTILSLPIVTIRKSSRRFCCQQASLCSVQTGRSSP